MTASVQWLERTLDDSANRRVVIPEAFLATDGILEILINIAEGLVVYPHTIAAHVAAELPFMASENILMAGVQAGGNRQDLHERIRVHSQAAAEQVKRFGKPNDLMARLKTDPAFARVNLARVLNAKQYIGRADRQVEEFIAERVAPIRKKYRKQLNQKVQLKV
jgi:adenylosuccinate lyase